MSMGGDIDEAFDKLSQIKALLDQIDTKTVKAEATLSEKTALLITTQQLLRALWRLSALLHRMGLPEDAAKAIRVFNELARTAMHVYYTMKLVEHGTLYGTIAGAVGVIGIILAAPTMLEGY